MCFESCPSGLNSHPEMYRVEPGHQPTKVGKCLHLLGVSFVREIHVGNSVRMGESPKIAGGYLYLPISFPVLPCSYGIKTCVLFFSSLFFLPSASNSCWSPNVQAPVRPVPSSGTAGPAVPPSRPDSPSSSARGRRWARTWWPRAHPRVYKRVCRYGALRSLHSTET